MTEFTIEFNEVIAKANGKTTKSCGETKLIVCTFYAESWFRDLPKALDVTVDCRLFSMFLPPDEDRNILKSPELSTESSKCGFWSFGFCRYIFKFVSSVIDLFGISSRHIQTFSLQRLWNILIFRSFYDKVIEFPIVRCSLFDSSYNIVQSCRLTNGKKIEFIFW